eukprot:m.218435 g.218435  ORF g.218435 m.218435 type:complete len:78 (-) comp26260_c0_seq1:587-820(-)
MIVSLFLFIGIKEAVFVCACVCKNVNCSPVWFDSICVEDTAQPITQTSDTKHQRIEKCLGTSTIHHFSGFQRCRPFL